MTRRFATLVLALSVTTGCFHGIDTKPYDIKLGPNLSLPDPGEVHPAWFLVGMVVIGASIIAAQQLDGVLE